MFIVGGSVAGLSAALILGRSLRKVLVIDSGASCNRQTPQSHSFMTRDGAKPAELSAIAREQALTYPTVGFQRDKVVSIIKDDGFFNASTELGAQFSARKILLATDVHDIMPDIEGFAECWGKSILHCPYCHGYEVRNEKLGVMIEGDHTVHYAGLIRHWSHDLTFFTNGSTKITTDQKEEIRRLKIPIIASPLAKIVQQNGMLSAVETQEGDHIALTALFAPVPSRQHGDLAQQLGCEISPAGLIVVNPFGETTVPGVFAAGDNSSPMRQIVIASAAGSMVGVFLNKELLSGLV